MVKTMLAESKHYSRQGHLLTKETIKSVLRRSTIAYKTAEVLYENSLYLPHILRQRLLPSVLGWRRAPSPLQARQSVLTWTVPIPPWNGPDDLIGSFHSQNIRVVEGAHTLYIAPQAALQRLMPSLVSFYPEQCGFKILKTCSDPLAGGYVYKNGRSLKLLMRLIGLPHDQLLPANYMFASGIGPRVHDLTCWESEGKRCTVFVVDHVAGGRPTERQYCDFLNRLKELNRSSRLRVLIPKWDENQDFAPPDCNGNLIYSDSLARAQYVDFQNFGLTRSFYSASSCYAGLTNPSTVTAFQVKALLTSREATAQKRWAVINDLLRERSVSLAGRLVLDIGCRSGIITGQALAAGAAWSLGWCEANLEQIQTRLLSWGVTRFSLWPIDRRDCSFERDVPDHLLSRLPEAVVFWRATTNGRNQLESLLRLPCAAFVCDYSDAEYAEDYLACRLPATQFEVIPDDKPSLFLIIRRH